MDQSILFTMELDFKKKAFQTFIILCTPSSHKGTSMVCFWKGGGTALNQATDGDTQVNSIDHSLDLQMKNGLLATAVHPGGFPLYFSRIVKILKPVLMVWRIMFLSLSRICALVILVGRFVEAYEVGELEW